MQVSQRAREYHGGYPGEKACPKKVRARLAAPLQEKSVIIGNCRLASASDFATKDGERYFFFSESGDST